MTSPASSTSAVPERPILPPPGRPTLVVILLIAKIALSLFILFATVRLDVLTEYYSSKIEGPRSPWVLELATDRKSIRSWQQALGFAAMAGTFVSVGLFLELVHWLHTMYRNLGAFGVTRRFASRWAILGFLVPGRNLVRPYQIAQEVWRRSGLEERDWQGPPRPERSSAIFFAWGAWLIAATLLVGRFISPPDAVQGLFLTCQVLSAVACGLTLLVIHEIQERQRSRWLECSTTPPAKPSRKLGPRHGIQAALLGLFGSAALDRAAAEWGSDLSLVLGAQVALLLASLAVVLRKEWSWRRERGQWSLVRTLAGSVLAGAGLSLAWSSLLPHAVPSALERSGWTDRPSAVERLGILAVLLLIAPVIEELVFRGAILQCCRGWRRGPAILLSSFLFACLDLQPVTMLVTFLLGCLCGTVRLAAGSLAPAVLLHAVYNLGTIVLLEGAQPEKVVTADLAWGAVWVGLGLLVASSGAHEPKRSPPE